MPYRRLGIIEIGFDSLAMLFEAMNGKTVISAPWPADAKILAVYVEAHRRSIWIQVESDEYDIVHGCDPLPKMPFEMLAKPVEVIDLPAVVSRAEAR